MKKKANILSLQIIITYLFLSFSACSQKNDTISLPAPQTTGGKPLMEALKERHSSREYSLKKLSLQTLSNLLWSADGYNRKDDKKRTAPSSMNYQEIDIYLAMEDGLYLYNAEKNILIKLLKEDIRQLTGKQDFVTTAPLNLVFVADYRKVKPPITDYQYKASYANTGFIAQNIYLFCASEGLGAVIRASFDEDKLSAKMKLDKQQKIILCQTVGYPK